MSTHAYTYARIRCDKPNLKKSWKIITNKSINHANNVQNTKGAYTLANTLSMCA